MSRRGVFGVLIVRGGSHVGIPIRQGRIRVDARSYVVGVDCAVVEVGDIMTAETVDRPISLAMARIADLAYALGVRDLNKRTACWEYQIDLHWWIAVNGTTKTIECSKEVEVEPYHCYVEFNGWPAGLFCPYGGTIAAGTAANERTFIEAIESLIKSVGGELSGQ